MKTAVSISAVALGLALAAPTASHAGPNEGGVLILHSLTGVTHTNAGSFCDDVGLGGCNEAVVQVEEGGVFVVYVLAAFPAAGSPRLAGTTYGITYPPDVLEIDGYGSCGDFVLATETWPDPGSGVAITWNEGQTDDIVEVQWLAVATDGSTPALLELTEHPSRGGTAFFADDDIPANLDIVVDLGKLGFGGEAGYLPCPDPVPVLETTWGSLKAVYRSRP